MARGDEGTLWQHSNAAHEMLLRTEDVAEGIAAFFGKRSPTGLGR